ncbi:MAG TPA: hypothetical protein ENN84_09285 [Candidatus Marinimicrobia bacterium]|nr:hypothetical protein [Candidatus Neomarinimicrobiota bacterium]
MKREYFCKLNAVVKKIIRGDYSQGTELDTILNDTRYPAKLLSFTEKLNLMTVKLEAREETLIENIEELQKKKPYSGKGHI